MFRSLLRLHGRCPGDVRHVGIGRDALETDGDCGAISEAGAAVGLRVYFSASAEELPIMWVDGALAKVLQLAHTRTHTHTGEQCVVMVVTAEPKNMEKS